MTKTRELLKKKKKIIRRLVSLKFAQTLHRLEETFGKDLPFIRFGVSLASAVGNCVSKLATGETSVVYGGLPLGRLVYPLSGKSMAKFGDKVSSSDGIAECKDVRLNLRNFCSVGNESVG